MTAYKATVSFAGKISMCEGEVRRLKEADAKPLLKCGYIKPARKEPVATQEKK